LLWIIIQTWPSLLCLKLPQRLLDENHWIYRTKNWEKNGGIYQKLFKVKNGKTIFLIPEVYSGSASLRKTWKA